MVMPCTARRWYVVVAEVEGEFMADTLEAMARFKSAKARYVPATPIPRDARFALPVSCSVLDRNTCETSELRSRRRWLTSLLGGDIVCVPIRPIVILLAGPALTLIVGRRRPSQGACQLGR